jgi:beta-xylosidase
MVCAIGGTPDPSTSHMVTVEPSSTAAGPWEVCPCDPIIRTRLRHEQWWSCGDGTIFITPAGDWWMAHNTYERGYYTLGRSMVLAAILWTEDG